MEAQVTSCDGFAGRQPLLLISRLHRSSQCLFIASNRPLNAYNQVSFLHAILCYHKSTDSVTFRIDSGVMSLVSRVYGSISIVCGGSGIPPQLAHARMVETRPFLLLLFGPGNEANLGHNNKIHCFSLACETNLSFKTVILPQKVTSQQDISLKNNV